LRVTGGELFALLNEVGLAASTIQLTGWIFHREEPLTHISVFVDSKPCAESVALQDRPDVAAFFGLPHARQSGIDIAAPGRSSLNRTSEIRLVARREGRPMGVLELTWRDPAADARRLPVPPGALQDRVGAMNFLTSGWRIYSDLKSALSPYVRISDCASVLDWGCGCGRALRYLLEDVPASRIHGCDIDADAIAWITQSIEGPSFTRIAPLPPTRYADQSFDLVYGISIFTHLNEATQIQWLEELRRITKPDGIVAVSVLGESFAPGELQDAVRDKGFADVISGQSGTFAAFSSADYYRVAYHSSRYVAAQWSQYFEVLELIPRGINAHQDLVIMRPKQQAGSSRQAPAIRG
jgi:SAM-dependent methyltransferase